MRRRPAAAGGRRVPVSRGLLITIAALLIVGFAVARTLPVGGGADAPAAPIAVEQPVPGTTPASVLRIIDGDTLDVRLDGEEVRVRLFGLDAPERGEPCYEEATARLGELAGDVVQLMPDERLEDRFGRALRYAYASDATFIDEVLVSEGFAVAWREDGRFRDQLLAEEQAARDAGVGCLWAG